ncbi:cGMP-specific 3',5'-cGMP phosphodiesterase 3-like [Pogonomyrmex barbatus]|uniref:cGMP-specific 3',5'-cGMP phosphodiesterase 3-like n=1 Tax=Pogonomyrmex barbatus TaxID=144034 RepID=A0A6I9WRU9_9HYME|nr:cGMP-specific 3',5'-cGMP phosphodiesterase 3-like [Pogonomyrmex barbatus]
MNNNRSTNDTSDDNEENNTIDDMNMNSDRLDNDISDDNEENYEMNENVNTATNSNNALEQLREVLYEDCDLTKEESEILIMSLALRHHFTDAALQDFIKVIDCYASAMYSNIYF